MTTFYAMGWTHRRVHILAVDVYRDTLHTLGVYARTSSTDPRGYEWMPVYAGDYCTIGA